MSTDLKIVTLNVNGMNDKIKRTQVYQFLRKNDVDIACIQETYLSKNKQRIIRNEWGGQIFLIMRN